MKLTLEPVLNLSASLIQDLQKMGLSLEYIEQLDLSQTQQRYFTATFNAKHMAFVAFETKGDINEIKYILVHPATRRRGVGYFVIEQLLQRVSGTFTCKLEELGSEELEVAKAFFAACGIKVVI